MKSAEFTRSHAGTRIKLQRCAPELPCPLTNFLNRWFAVSGGGWCCASRAMRAVALPLPRSAAGTARLVRQSVGSLSLGEPRPHVGLAAHGLVSPGNFGRRPLATPRARAGGNSRRLGPGTGRLVFDRRGHPRRFGARPARKAARLHAHAAGLALLSNHDPQPAHARPAGPTDMTYFFHKAATVGSAGWHGHLARAFPHRTGKAVRWCDG